MTDKSSKNHWGASSWTGGMLIDGCWRDGAAGERLTAYNPATGQPLGTMAAADEADVDHAVSAARLSFEERRWTGLPAAERGKRMMRVADLLEAGVDEIARIETLDNGMPLAMAKGLVMRSAEMFRYFAGWCTKVHGQSTELGAPDNPVLSYTLREPVGVAALIIPWNVPIVSASQKLAVALAAGCSVVLKPAEEASFTSLRLGEILMQAAIPDGVVNIVTGLGEVAGAALVRHDDVDKVSFTGSGEVGRSIVRASAEGNLKRVTLELGGKSPVILFDDADLAKAVPNIAMGIFRNSGQVCAAGSRLYVQRGLYDRVLSELAEHAGSLKLGDGLDPETQMGPLISAAHRERVRTLVKKGIDDGAELVAGGDAPSRDGYFMAPTILAAPPAASDVQQQEIFGPVLTATVFDSPEEATALANDTSYGLAAAVWTRDIGTAHRMARSLRAGMVWINCASMADASVPFGGYKQSGWGREHGWEGVEAFLETKSVFAAL